MNPHGTSEKNRAFWDAHGRVGLVWSNPDASDDVLIAHALLEQPNFHLLLDIAAHFGFHRLVNQWNALRATIEERQYPEEIRKLNHARPIVDRCLTTMNDAIRSKP